jgi:hypothetical protein
MLLPVVAVEQQFVFVEVCALLRHVLQQLVLPHDLLAVLAFLPVGQQQTQTLPRLQC